MRLTERRTVRLGIAFILGIVITLILNATLWNSSAKAAPTCSSGWTRYIDFNCQPMGHEINTSKDLRQAAGNTLASCIVGLKFGGKAGCLAGAVGALVTSIPYDGTWD